MNRKDGPLLNCVLVLDLGTTSCKGALYSREGERVATASEGYPMHYPAPHFAEQDPGDYLHAARSVTRKLTAGSPTICAVGFSTQTPTLVLLDEAGRPLGPAILWQDSRAGEQAEWIGGVDPRVREEWFGMDLPNGAAATPAKLLWVKQNDPERWAKVRWVVQPKDYVSLALTGKLAADRWCAKGIAHLNTGEMAAEWLQTLGLTRSICPPVRSMRSVTKATPNDWGIAEGTPVVVGWSDAMAAVLATGAMQQENRAFILTGTSEIVGVSRRGKDAAKGLFYVPPDVMEVEELSLHYGPTQAGGSCLAWMSLVLGRPVEELLREIPAEPVLSPVVFRPYLQGERAPFWDHTLTASFDGLTMQHKAPDLVRAVLQGVALHERLVIETAEGGHAAADVVLAGGAARDVQWNQLRANVLQRRVLVMQDTEASLRGAAIIAWDAAGGVKGDAWFAAEELHPDVTLAAAVTKLYARFRTRR